MRWADDAGSVTVAALSVTRWDDVASDLQPKFKMDSDIALAQSIPTTESLDERLSDLITANLQAALPTTVTSDVATTKTDPETGLPVTTVDRTRTRKSGEASAAGEASLPAATAAALAAVAPGKLDRDPMLKYLAATALQQEVMLLNRYVRDAVRYRDSQAFLVRLQVSVLPNRRGMPYDVITDITLHPQDIESAVGLAGGVMSQNAAEAAHPLDPRDVTGLGGRCKGGSYDRVSIIPMVVTDNLEGLQASRSSDIARQLGLAVLATAGNVGLGGKFARTTEALRQAQGSDTNSILSVGKLTDDTVRVRLGAVQNPRFQYTTLTRTHNISLLVLYRPCEVPTQETEKVFTAVAKSTFRDAISGEALEYRSASERIAQQMNTLRSKYPGHYSYLEFTRLYQWASRQDAWSFFNFVISKAPFSHECRQSVLDSLMRRAELGWGSERPDLLDDPADQVAVSEWRRNLTPDQVKTYGNRDEKCLSLSVIRYKIVAAALWTDLQSFRPAGEFSFTAIPVMLRPTKTRLPPDQTVLITNGDSEASSTLSGAQDLATFRTVRATLMAPDNLLKIEATEVKVAPDGRSITAKFPPLSSFEIKEQKGYNLKLALADFPKDAPCSGKDTRRPSEEGVEWCERTYEVRFKDGSSPAAKPGFTLSAGASGIIADRTGKGRLTIRLKKNASPSGDPKPLYLAIDGAELSKVETGASRALVDKPGQGWQANAAGEATLFFENLIPNQVVTVSLEDDGKGVSSVKKTVIAQAAGGKEE